MKKCKNKVLIKKLVNILVGIYLNAFDKALIVS